MNNIDIIFFTIIILFIVMIPYLIIKKGDVGGGKRRNVKYLQK